MECKNCGDCVDNKMEFKLISDKDDCRFERETMFKEEINLSILTYTGEPPVIDISMETVFGDCNISLSKAEAIKLRDALNGLINQINIGSFGIK